MRHKAMPRYIFDIETRPMPEDFLMDYVPPIKAPKNVKDPDKIADAVADKTADWFDRAGLDGDLGTVSVIAGQIGTRGRPEVVIVPPDGVVESMSEEDLDVHEKKLAYISGQIAADASMEYRNRLEGQGSGEAEVHVMSEVDALKFFWGRMNMCNGANIGYNQLGFDIPFLLKRSMHLGVRPGIKPQMMKFRTEPTTDLMPILVSWAWGEQKKLKWIGKRYGFEILAEGVDGSMAANMSDEELLLYGLSDIWLTAQLYNKMNGYYFDHYAD